MITTTGKEGFHFYTIKRPELKATMLLVGCDLKPGLHHSNMTFDRRIIPIVVTILSDALQKIVKVYSEEEHQ